MRSAFALLALATFALLLPSGYAHGAVNAKEVEVLVVEDFADDSVYELGGYDLYQIYVGEAYLPGVGDGFYFHTLLFGDFGGRPSGQKEFRVTFTVKAGQATLTRALWTTDGSMFESDFDKLEHAEATADGVEIQRAFVSLSSSNLTAGTVLSGLKVESLVDGDLRDRAPGGRFVPNSGGAAEIPETGGTTMGYTLAGPSKYISVKAEKTELGHQLNISSLLTEGGQHVMVVFPQAATDGSGGWIAEARAIGGPDLPGKTAKTIVLTLEPRPINGLVPPMTFDVITDIGGRVPLVAAVAEGVIVVVPAPSTLGPGAYGQASAKESPAGPLGTVLIALVSSGVLFGRQTRD